MSTTGLSAPLSPAKPALPAGRRPGWLTFFVIAAIALGALRLWGGIMLPFQGRMMDFQRDMLEKQDASGRPNPVLDMQRQMYQEMNDVTGTFIRKYGVLLAVGALASVLVIVGGVGSFKLRPRFRLLLMAGLVACLGVDAVMISPEINMAVDTSQITAGMMKKIADASGVPDNRVLGALGVFTESARWMTLIGAAAMIGARVLLNLSAFFFLSRKATQAVFAAAEAQRRGATGL